MANTKIPSELSSTPSISDGGNATAITIDSSENVIIGNSSALGLLTIKAPSSDDQDLITISEDGTNQAFSINSNFAGAGSTNNNITLDSYWTNDIISFRGDGNVGINTDSAFSPLHISKTDWSSGAPYGTVATIEGNNVNDANWGHLIITDTTTSNGNGGSIRFAIGSTSSLNPFAGIQGVAEGASYGGVGIYTRPNGGTATERIRITSAGYLQVGNVLQGDTALNVTETSANNWTAAFYNNTSTPYGPLISFTGAAPNDSTKKFLQMSDTSTTRAVFYSNGGLHNYQSNNSNLSDSREKKNIVDADAAWDDVKAWNIKKFHYNEDEDSDPKRLGVIAQDLETNNPELIQDFQKRAAVDEVLWTEEDELPEGVSVGDVKTPAVEEIIRKGVKEQQMYWVAIKALQEALTKIEQLESRIETLEG